MTLIYAEANMDERRRATEELKRLMFLSVPESGADQPVERPN
jgi:hypothetical protein